MTGSLVAARSWFAAASFLLAGLCFMAIPWAESAAGVIALMSVALGMLSMLMVRPGEFRSVRAVSDKLLKVELPAQ
jgi:hypothetical protein